MVGFLLVLSLIPAITILSKPDASRRRLVFGEAVAIFTITWAVAVGLIWLCAQITDLTWISIPFVILWFLAYAAYLAARY